MPSDLLEVFATWTPYLAVGFAWNILISVAAMLLGMTFGAGLAHGRLSARPGLGNAARLLTEVTRNVPTFVCLFYLAFLLPSEIPIGAGLALTIPAWFKAALALSVAVCGYVSDTLSEALMDRRHGRPEGMILFLPNCVSYFLIIVMASSTASVIGVAEIVSRANTVISATGRSDVMVWIYLYAMIWFLVFCWPLTLLMRRLQAAIRTRAGRPAA